MMTNKAKSSPTPRGTVRCENTTIELLKANDFVAQTIRRQMAEHGILMLNITSSPGSGKTTLLEETGKRLGSRFNIKILVGDLETERDAERLRNAQLEAYQIVTGGICHLESQMILQALDAIELEGTDILIVENVGNLVCPASFDLGEDYRVTLLSVTEGDDKPRKYPRMFLSSELMLISKSDLLPYLPFSVERAIEDARQVNPDIEVMTISSLTGEGLDQWCQWIEERYAAKKHALSDGSNQ